MALSLFSFMLSSDGQPSVSPDGAFVYPNQLWHGPHPFLVTH